MKRGYFGKDKPIQGLRHCARENGMYCGNCPYEAEGDCTSQLAKDTLALIETLQKTRMNSIVICNECQFYRRISENSSGWNECSLHCIKTYDNNYCWWGCAKSEALQNT